MKDFLSKTFFVLLLSFVCVRPVAAAVVTSPIEYKEGDHVFKGYLAYDDAVKGKAPGVLVVHEWWGLNDFSKKKAEELAGLGYVALAVDMYGDGKTTTKTEEASAWSGAVKGNILLMQQRIAGWLKVLKDNEKVDAGKTGAIGFCFGGTTVLELAYSGADTKGVVSFHGGLIPPTTEDLPKIKSAFLVLHGADDTFTKPEDIANFRVAMKDAKTDWQMQYFGGAVHGFTNPDADKAGIPGVAYNEKAAKRSWQDMKDFFQELFK